MQRLLLILGILVLLVVIIAVASKIVTLLGKNRLKGNANTQGPVLEENVAETNEAKVKYASDWQDGWISYKGQVYAYNDDIRTFLILGIDPAHQGGDEKFDELTDGGQSDGIYLMILNPRDESIRVLAVNRDTEAEIVMVGIGEGGTDIVAKSQITNQHGFGGGKEYSCELTRDAVSKLLYNVPIHGYAAINYKAIPKINDAVGGVQVTLNQDYSDLDKSWTEGTTLTFHGEEAYKFIKYRDTNVFESQRMRLGRQKLYLTSLIKQAKSKTRDDIILPISMYNSLKDYMVTDLTVDKVGYMASEYINYDFDGENIYTMEGETVLEDDGYEHFYPDEDALKDMIIELYYEPVER